MFPTGPGSLIQTPCDLGCGQQPQRCVLKRTVGVIPQSNILRHPSENVKHGIMGFDVLCIQCRGDFAIHCKLSNQMNKAISSHPRNEIDGLLIDHLAFDQEPRFGNFSEVASFLCYRRTVAGVEAMEEEEEVLPRTWTGCLRTRSRCSWTK